MGARLVDDVGEHHRLAGLGLGELGERQAHLHLEVVAHAFAVVERAVILPDHGGTSRHLLVDRDLPLRHDQDETVDIGHETLLTLNLIVKRYETAHHVSIAPNSTGSTFNRLAANSTKASILGARWARPL